MIRSLIAACAFIVVVPAQAVCLTVNTPEANDCREREAYQAAHQWPATQDGNDFICTGECMMQRPGLEPPAKPLTTEWIGYIDDREIGLRSDGVVIWRETK